MQFTEAQQTAIDHRDGHLRIVACAGSGKTQVLVHRIVGLLNEGVSPRNIIAFTFTEKAAAELKERVRNAVVEAGLSLNGLVEMFIGTIHGWCLDFLQSSLNKYLKFRVLNEVQTKLLISRYSRQSGLSTVEYLSGAQLKRHKHDVRKYHEMLNVLREDDINYGEVPPSLLEALDMYRELLHQHAVFDYSELMHVVVEGFKSSDSQWKRALEGLHERLQYLMVDEYQDVNPIQEHLISMMIGGGANLTVVGDDDQTIYAWRGSNLENILNFNERYDNVTTVQVTKNFRSTPAIVETAKRVVENNQQRLPKAFETGSHHIHEDGDMMALSFDSQEEEASFIAQRAEDFLGMPYTDDATGEERGLAWGDMAILLRSVRKDAGVLIEALRQRGIPFVVRGVQQLFDQPEIQACVSLFDYVAGKTNHRSLEAAWIGADLGITSEQFQEALASLPDIHDEDISWSDLGLQKLFLAFLEHLGLTEEGVPDAHDNDAGALIYFNLGMFSQLISDFEQIHFKTPPPSKYEAFTNWLQYDAPDLYDEGGLDSTIYQPNAVNIMTVHQAKGLQWPCVFMPALQRNRFPAKAPGGRTLWHLLPKEAVDNQERYASSEEDERRLFYVGITRAEKYLTCSFAPGESRNLKRPSKFLQEFVYGGYALTEEIERDWAEPMTPTPRVSAPSLSISFSEWKYWSECPYAFKLRFIFGFNPPLVEAIGYGKSLHDALAEAHRRAIAGKMPTQEDIGALLHNHLNLPFAYPTMHQNLEKAAERALANYFQNHSHNLVDAIHSEKAIEFSPRPGLVVQGRIDLVIEQATNIVRLVDFKSTARAQMDQVSNDQLMIYAEGFKELEGRYPDYIEVINLDENGQATRDKVEESKVTRVIDSLQEAGNDIRTGRFLRVHTESSKCGTCDMKGICGR